MNSKAPYILALCEAAQQSSAFGLATRLGAQSSTCDVDAAKVIHSIVKFSPAAECVAVEVLNEFQKVPLLHYLVASVLFGGAHEDTHQWAQAVLMALHNLDPQQLSIELKPVLDLASKYLTHLLIAVRNPGGKRTPQESVCPTPDKVQPLAHIRALINEAVIERTQAALKTLVYARDGYKCALTDYSFDRRVAFVKPRCAHILPFSLHGKPASLCFIESFTGKQFSAEAIRANINHPRNAFNDAHEQFDELKWGIEATIVDGQTKYLYRQVASKSCGTMRRCDGDEILFNGGKNGDMIDGPDPEYCNLRLAIARALHACGAADIIDETYADDDDDDFVAEPVYFGGPYFSDEVLCRRLDDQLALST